MTRLSIMFTLSLALAACGGKAATPTTTPTEKPDAAATFELGEVTIFEGDQAMVKIHADGNSEIGGTKSGTNEPAHIVWKPGPSFKTDGTIEFKGEAVGKVNADGTMMANGKTVPVTITADKVTFEKGSISLAADGTMTLAGGNDVKPEKAPHVAGADTPGKRRLALTLVAILMTGEQHEPGPAVETTAPATKP